MYPEREEEASDSTQTMGPDILPDWRDDPVPALTQRFCDRFVGDHHVSPLHGHHETRSIDLDPVDARENELSPGVSRRLRRRQMGMKWPAPVRMTRKPSGSWE